MRIRFTDKQPLTTTWPLSAPERIRVLRQRESDRAASALEPGARAAAARLVHAARRRRCSTATPTRWRASTPAWISGRTSRPMRASGRGLVQRVPEDPAGSIRSVFVACALPLVLLLRRRCPCWCPRSGRTSPLPWTGDLGVNPVETLLHDTGRNALRAAARRRWPSRPSAGSPGWNRVQRFGGWSGVWSFVYALLPLPDLRRLRPAGRRRRRSSTTSLKRQFIFVGDAGVRRSSLVLAATSTNGMIRRLGRRWQRLHRLVYVAAVGRRDPLRLGPEGGHPGAAHLGRHPGGAARRSRVVLGGPEAAGEARAGRKSLNSVKAFGP